MSKLSTTLTVKNGSTTKTVNLYSSTSDMSDSTYTNEYLTCKCNGSTAYIAVASSGTTAYTTYGTPLKYKNSSGVDKYILTEPYFVPYTPSYSGTITIPAMTFYENNNSDMSDYFDYATQTNQWASSSFYCNEGDTITIPQASTFYIKEGTTNNGEAGGAQYIDTSSYTGHLCIGTGTYGGNANICNLSCYLEGGGDGHEGGTKSYSQAKTTYTVTKAGNYYVSIYTVGIQLRYKGKAYTNAAVNIQVN